MIVAVLTVTSGSFAAANHFLITDSGQIKNGAVSVSDLSKAARKALKGQKGSNGAAGIPGKDGANGATGATGATGANGAQGPKGDAGAAGAAGKDGAPGKDGSKGETGEQGPKGDKGDKGDSWSPSYASASVMVQRGSGGVVPWATYSTTLGAPAGDNTGGTFRFTCTDTHGTCKVSIQASGPAGTIVYPRVLIYKEDYNAGGPST